MITHTRAARPGSVIFAPPDCGRLRVQAISNRFTLCAMKLMVTAPYLLPHSEVSRTG